MKSFGVESSYLWMSHLPFDALIDARMRIPGKRSSLLRRFSEAAATLAVLFFSQPIHAGPEFRGLGHLPGGASSPAHGISADGTTVVGRGESASGNEAFRWTSGSGGGGIGHFDYGPGSGSHAYGVSADGSTIVGTNFGSPSGSEAFRWTSATGLVRLGDPPVVGFYVIRPEDASSDGSTIVGYIESESGWDAFIWDTTYGLHKLSLVLERQGLDLGDWRLSSAEGISDDGRVIVGYGINPTGGEEAWLAALDDGSRDAPALNTHGVALLVASLLLTSLLGARVHKRNRV
jgi:uncharacterized membrane protein